MWLSAYKKTIFFKLVNTGLLDGAQARAKPCPEQTERQRGAPRLGLQPMKVSSCSPYGGEQIHE